MYIKRTFSIPLLFIFTWRIGFYSFLLGVAALLLYDGLGWKWVAIPWLPVSIIGTAVSFYVGFKSSQSYDRLWEARKIWGGITNTSRAFATIVRAFVTDTYADQPVLPERIRHEHKILIFRHLAWLHALKHLMKQPAVWEHQRRLNTRYRRFFEKEFAFNAWEDDLKHYLTAGELQWLREKKNPAVQLLDAQSQHLAQLRKEGLLSEFGQLEIQKCLTDLLAEQGRSERIKNFPFPRHFATTGQIFVGLFALLLPFGLLNEFTQLEDGLAWMLIPCNIIVTWVLGTMELNGDYSENPFEGLVNDIPLIAIVRNLEIDLKDMLDAGELPEKIQPVEGVLL